MQVAMQAFAARRTLLHSSPFDSLPCVMFFASAVLAVGVCRENLSCTEALSPNEPSSCASFLAALAWRMLPRAGTRACLLQLLKFHEELMWSDTSPRVCHFLNPSGLRHFSMSKSAPPLGAMLRPKFQQAFGWEAAAAARVNEGGTLAVARSSRDWKPRKYTGTWPLTSWMAYWSESKGPQLLAAGCAPEVCASCISRSPLPAWNAGSPDAPRRKVAGVFLGSLAECQPRMQHLKPQSSAATCLLAKFESLRECKECIFLTAQGFMSSPHWQ